MGHSAGGVFTQILLDHGFGAAGVAINSAPTEGVKVVPLSQIRSTFPVLKNPANRHRAVGFTPGAVALRVHQHASARRSRRRLYERYHIPASGRDLLGQRAGQHPPGHRTTLGRLPQRRPRAAAVHLRQRGPPHAAEDPAVQRQALQVRTRSPRSRSSTGPHLLPAQAGWEEVADYALDWALAHATRPSSRLHDADVRVTHIGGPTVLIEVDGWRILTDPTFDPPGRTYRFGWGTASRKVAGPAIAAADLGPIDAVLLSHDHHADNLDDAGRALLPSAGRVVTTVAGARRLGGDARGLAPWPTTPLEAPGRPTIEITATPCRHGPPLSRPIIGDVIGFALRWHGQEHGALWISGDTVLYDGVRAGRRPARGRHRAPAPRRRAVPGHRTGALHDDGKRRRRTAAGSSARARSIPVHYEGWSTSGRAATRRAELARAPDGVPRRVRWLPTGERTELSA